MHDTEKKKTTTESLTSTHLRFSLLITTSAGVRNMKSLLVLMCSYFFFGEDARRLGASSLSTEEHQEPADAAKLALRVIVVGFTKM